MTANEWLCCGDGVMCGCVVQIVRGSEEKGRGAIVTAAQQRSVYTESVTSSVYMYRLSDIKSTRNVPCLSALSWAHFLTMPCDCVGCLTSLGRARVAVAVKAQASCSASPNR
jgi:hypothetical protein